MGKWVLIISAFVLPVHSRATWDAKDIYLEKTQVVRIDLIGKSNEGVLLMKHLKFGKPIYFISTFSGKSVSKTKMVTESAFYQMFTRLHELVNSFETKPIESGECGEQLAISKKLEGNQVFSSQFCLDNQKLGQNEFSSWYLPIKNDL